MTAPLSKLESDLVAGHTVAPSGPDPALDLPAAGRPLRNALVAAAPVIGVLGFLGVWQALVVAFDVDEFVLPAPSRIIDHIASDPGFYVHHARVTLWEAFLGFGIAAVCGIAVGAAMAHSRFVERAVLPLAVLVQVTPIIAYAPAVVLWTGFGLQPILLITALVCSVPFVINALSGLRSVDPNLIELARSVDATRWQIFVRLRLPSSLPYLFSAARIAVGLALIGAVLGEISGGATEGLGWSVGVAQVRGLRFTLQLWGSIFVLALIGALATLLITTIERLVLHWHPSQRR